MVPVLPITVKGIEILDVRAIVWRVTIWLPFTLHPLPPLPSVVKHEKFAEIETDFVPSAFPSIQSLLQGAPEYPPAAMIGYASPWVLIVQL